MCRIRGAPDDHHGGPLVVPQDATRKQPKKIGQYEIESRIAEGGFGVVYIGHDPRLNRRVAIKILHQYHASDPDRVKRFVREARSAARLNDPGIVQVYDVVEAEGRMALVMEYVRGKNLDVYLKDNPHLTLADKLKIAAQIADTLHTAHQAGIIHRDVKPANVMIDESGLAKLSDFSLARLVDTTLTPLTGVNDVLGTPAYMSPEQCQGLDAVPQSDIYSLGVMIYEMAAGNRPFEAENYLALLRHHTDTPPTPIRLLKPSLPRALEELVMKCLAKSIRERPASGKELAQALRQMIADGLAENYGRAAAQTVALKSHAIDAHTAPAEHPDQPRYGENPRAEAASPAEVAVTPMPPIQRKKGRRPWAPAVVIAVVFVAALAGAFWLGRRPAPDESLPASVSTFWSETPLRDYVQRRDDSFAYKVHSTIEREGYTAHVLDVTSQAWHPGETVPPLWRHWLTVVIPNKITKDKALLVCSEGFSTAERPLSEVPHILLATALTTQSIVAIMEGFPRDPVGFQGEDPADTDRHAFAVATFLRFLDTADPTWPIVCPLVKSVVRAMDAVEQYVAGDLNLETPLEGFVLTGEANGWGIWLTGAVDERVAAIAPVQFDLLNIGEQIEFQVGFKQALSPFLTLFSDTGVMPALDTTDGERLLRIIDPLAYQAQLSMPKLLLLPASNPYTSIDGVNLYCERLKGDTHLFCAPNLALSRGNPFLAQAGSMVALPGQDGRTQYSSQDFRDTLLVFYHQLLVGKPMPRYAWDILPDGAFQVTAEDPPAEARLWVAKSDSRDFRGPDEEDWETATDDFAESAADAWETDTAPGAEGDAAAMWQMERLTSRTPGAYDGKVKRDESKHTAFYVELIYPSKLGMNYSLTTPTTILPPEEAPTQVMEPKSSLLEPASRPTAPRS